MARGLSSLLASSFAEGLYNSLVLCVSFVCVLFRHIGIFKWYPLSDLNLEFLNFESSVQLISHVWLFAAPWTAAHQASLTVTNSRGLFTLVSIESVMLSNHLIFCRPLLPPSIFPSIGVFSSESVLCFRWPKYWSFSFSISPSNEYQDWFPLGLTGLISLQSKGLSSLLQHYSQKHEFFGTQLSL